MNALPQLDAGADSRRPERRQGRTIAHFLPATDRAAMLVLLARNPAMLSLLSRADADKDLGEVVLGNQSLEGRALRDLGLPGDVLLVSVQRDGELLVPRGNTRLELGDRLTVVGSPPSVRATRAMLV